MRQAGLAPAPRWTPLRVVGVAAVAAAAIVAIDRLPHPGALVSSQAEPPPVPAMGPARTYQDLYGQQSATLAARRDRASSRADEWLIHEQYARSAFARGRLSGSYDDYHLAQEELDRAFQVAPPGTGPHLSQAVLDLMMHRLAHAEQMLAAIEGYAVGPDSGERAEMAGMRGDIAFYRGDYAGAQRGYDEADRLAPGSSDFRRAIFHAKTGRPDLAQGYFDRYEQKLVRPDRHMRANMALQRGILELDFGRLEEAMAHFRAAEALFPGWWLVEEHIAETTALLGDKAGAERLYRGIIDRTGNPEFMDALAALLIERGQSGEAEKLRRRSAIIWDRRIKQFPEASYGHALSHCVTYGQTDCALRLARRNFAARPYGEAGEQLATALVASGHPEEARGVIDQVLASPWRTAHTDQAASQTYAALGDRARAEEYRAAALRLNPHIPL